MAAQREWFEKDYYKVLGVSEKAEAEGDHARLPQAGAREPPRRQPRQRRGRGALQGDLVGLRRRSVRPEKRKEYDEVRALGPMGGFGGPGGGGGFGGGPGGFTFDMGGGGGWATCSATSSAVVAAAPGVVARGTGPAARRRPRSRAPPGLHRRRRRPVHHAAPGQRRRLQHLHRLRCRAGHHPHALPLLCGPRRDRRQPGHVRHAPALPHLRRRGCASSTRADLPGHRRGTAPA